LYSIRNSAGKCLSLKSEKEVEFTKCNIEDKYSQYFKLIKEGESKLIKTLEDQYLSKAKKSDEKYISSKSSKFGKLVLKQISNSNKYHIYDPQIDKNSSGMKYCMSSVYGNKFNTAKCSNKFDHQIFTIIKKGASPEALNKKNEEYENRNKVNLEGYNQIVSIGGNCATALGDGKVIEVHQCKTDAHKFFFKITKNGNYYNIETELNHAIIKGNKLVKDATIFETKSKDGDKKLRDFKITKEGGSYKITTVESNLCLSRDFKSTESPYKLAECKTDDINQSFSIKGYKRIEVDENGNEKNSSK